MEDILFDIKTKISTCSKDEMQRYIKEWREQFRQRGISIIALERLLNFYLMPHPDLPSNDDAFVHPQAIANMPLLDNEEEFKILRSKVESLEREKTILERKLQNKHKFCLLLAFVTIMISFLFFFLLIK